MDIMDVREYLVSLPAVEECQPFGEEWLVYKVGGRMFAAYGFERPQYLPVKCAPDRAILLRDEFPAITNAGLASEPITVGKGQYFVLGDNRNNSEDSRHNGMGLVNSDRIVGKLWFTISPWKKIGFV